MVAMVVLAVTAAGLMSLHFGAIRGLAGSSSMSTAMDIATQRLELYALEGDDVMRTTRGCGAVLAGCALATPNPTAGGPFGPNGPCTVEVDGAGVGGVATNGKFRLDTTVNPLFGAQAGGLDVMVSVCWTEDTGRVRKVESRRLLAPRDRGGT